jgi:hypothetical protein
MIGAPASVPSASLYLAFCDRTAANYSVRRWHYSRCLPAGRLVMIGVWEDGRFVGCIIFSRGANKDVARRFGLRQTEAVELTRIALAEHTTPTSRIVSIALKLLKRQSPGVRCAISFADPAAGHAGTLYRACNFQFLGMTNSESMLRIGGQLRHARSVTSRFKTRGVNWLRQHVDPHAERVMVPPKYRFAFAFDAVTRELLRPFVRRYPLSGESSGSGTPGHLHGQCKYSPRKGRCDATSPLHHAHEAVAHG